LKAYQGREKEGKGGNFLGMSDLEDFTARGGSNGGENTKKKKKKKNL